MVRILTCVDLDSLFALLCGERLESGKVKLAVGEGQLERYGRDNFQKLFEYVCSLEHVQALATDFVMRTMTSCSLIRCWKHSSPQDEAST